MVVIICNSVKSIVIIKLLLLLSQSILCICKIFSIPRRRFPSMYGRNPNKPSFIGHIFLLRERGIPIVKNLYFH